jgi:hypothetical protein
MNYAIELSSLSFLIGKKINLDLITLALYSFFQEKKKKKRKKYMLS